MIMGKKYNSISAKQQNLQILRNIKNKEVFIYLFLKE